MHGLTQRLTEREKEIARLKEKLRDLTNKLKEQHQQYGSKVFVCYSLCVHLLLLGH